MILLLAACSAPPPEPDSVWEMRTVGHSATWEAPALLARAEPPLLVWPQTGDGDPILTRWTDEPQSLGFRAEFPLEINLYPAPQNRNHLLYLDADPARDGLRLRYALLNSDGSARVGPFALADEPVQRYDALPAADDGLIVVWSGGRLQVPALYQQRIDAAGRFSFPELLMRQGEYPALIGTADGPLLFWRRERAIWLAPLADPDSERPIAPVPLIRATDRLDAFTVGLDAGSITLLWQIVRENTEPEVWTTTGNINDSRWPDPQRLRLPTPASDLLATGFGHPAQRITRESSPDDPPVTWATPLAGQRDLLPLAASLADGRLGVLYLRRGQIVGWEAVTDNVRLLSPPRIAAHDNRLYLSWADSEPDAARLMLAYQRPS